MLSSSDHLLCVLLDHLRSFPAERVRACRAAAADSDALRAALAEAGPLSQEEIHAWSQASAYLLRGGHAHACARCRALVLDAPGTTPRCPICRRSTEPGVLPDPTTVTLTPAVGSLARKLAADLSRRDRARACVAATDRLRTAGSVGQRPEIELAPAAAAVADAVLGPYELLALVGRGSHSYVYKARDRRTDAVVALKVLYFSGEEAEATVRECTERFRREAALANRIRHPALLQPGPLEQTGRWHHLAMPFVDGPTLAHVLEARQAGLPRGAAPALTDFPGLAQALCGVADGLHYAHCNGVIHRDVSPRNILFSADGTRAYLGDFGVAKVAGAAMLTGKKARLGERGYAAPERLTSEALASPRSDVYSLGVILFEILAGRPPSDADLGNRTVTPRAINPDIPVGLEEVVLQAMAVRPEERFASAQEFAEALDQATSAMTAAPERDADAAPPRPSLAERAGTLGADARTGAELLIAVLLGLGAGWILAHAAPKLQPAPLAEVRRALDALAGSNPQSYESARIEAERQWRRLRAQVAATEVELASLDAHWHLSQARFREAEAALAQVAGTAELSADDRARQGLAAEMLGSIFGDGTDGRHYRTVAHDAAFAAASLAPESAAGQFAYALLQVETGRFPPALATFDALANSPWRLPAQAMALRARVSLGALTAALAAVDAATAFPPDPVLMLQQARVLAVAGRTADAVRITTRARALWPDHFAAALLEARLRLGAGEPGKSREMMADVLNLAPTCSEAHFLEGAAWAALGDPCAALAAYTRAAETGWDRAELYFERGMLRTRHGDRAGGHHDLRQFLARVPAGARATQARQALREE